MADPIDISQREIVTQFDKTVAEDVVLEQIDGQEPGVATTLKNAENIYKSFAYLKRLYSGSISTRRVLSGGTVAVGATQALVVTEEADAVELVNLSTTENMIVTINTEEMTFPPAFRITIPIRSSSASAIVNFTPDEVSVFGNVTYMMLGGE